MSKGDSIMEFQKELVAEFDREAATTRRMLEAIPPDVDYAFKPNPKSMTLGRLAGHIVEAVGDWAMRTLNADKMEIPAGHKFDAYAPTSKHALIERFDKDVAGVRSALNGFNPVDWRSNWKFISDGQVWINDTKYNVWRTWVMNHLVHHRAQLGVRLRILGSPIPGTYGPSADET